ncbi:hypothetical protein [Lichenicoccus sp.]|uniref:hypothetical protein n=1 Tax=Lichenicoccus sp. TaxID=2781899 RepID=UPI003D0C1366
MNTSTNIQYRIVLRDDFLELLEQIRKETPMPNGTLPIAGQRHYQAVIYTYLEDLLA